MSLEEEVSRARNATLLIENPMFRETFTLVRDGIINALVDCPIRDREGAHELKLMLKLLGDLEGNIKRVIDTGKMAAIQLERDQKISEFKTKNRFA